MAKRSINTDFAKELVTRRVNLLRYTQTVRGKVLDHLRLMETELVRKVRESELAGTDYTKLRLKALLRQTRETINTYYGNAETQLDQELLNIAQVEGQTLQAIAAELISKQIETVVLTPTQLERIVNTSLVRGAPSEDWWSKQSLDTTLRFESEMRLGLSMGETNDQLVKRLRGTPTGKRIVIGDKTVRETTGGVMQTSRNEAEALVRTSVQKVSNDTLMQTYKENSDLIKGVQLIVTLDSRTTPICIALSGGAWDLDGAPLPDSPVKRPYPGPPPYHWNCRSVIVPITKSWEELSGIKGLGEQVPDDTRASMDGQVPKADLTYESWLKEKDKEDPQFARDVLGDGRYELWKAGDIKLNQLVSDGLKPLTLQQLKDLN